jgi:hypothetical protein
MKHLRVRILPFYALLLLLAASLGPVVVHAVCRDIIVACADGRQKNCPGHQEGTKCWYEETCLNFCG